MLPNELCSISCASIAWHTQTWVYKARILAFNNCTCTICKNERKLKKYRGRCVFFAHRTILSMLLRKRYLSILSKFRHSFVLWVYPAKRNSSLLFNVETALQYYHQFIQGSSDIHSL